MEDIIPASFEEYDNHHKVIRLTLPGGKTYGFIAIHKKRQSPSFGATRLYLYKNEDDALRDALRLSKMMSFKAAIAGLPAGGAKGVIIDGILPKEEALKLYAKAISNLAGEFITGADMGIDDKDLSLLKNNTPYIVGIHSRPVWATGITVVKALREALEYVYKDDRFQGKKVLIQGVGKIGIEIGRSITPYTLKTFLTDIDSEKAHVASKTLENSLAVPNDSIGTLETDTFIPCGFGGVITESVARSIKTKIICGGANNQLVDDSIAQILHERSIIYIPDYLANCGGLISVYMEYQGITEEDEVKKELRKVREITKEVLMVSEEKNIPPLSVVKDIVASRLKALQ